MPEVDLIGGRVTGSCKLSDRCWELNPLIFIIFFKLHLCIYFCEGGVQKCCSEGVGVRGQLAVLFHYVGSRFRAQLIISLGRKHLYPLSPPIMSFMFIGAGH